MSHSSTSATQVVTKHVHDGELAQLANYEPPENHQAQQQAERHRADSQNFRANDHQGAKEPHANHGQHVHQDSEPNADMTLLQTLQAALAAAPPG